MPDEAAERNRLHDIQRLVVWGKINDEDLLAEARYEIAKSVARLRGDDPPLAKFSDLIDDALPDLFGGMLVPIDEEIIAAPRFENARERFEELLGRSLRSMRERCTGEFPSSFFYAYKQQEEEQDGRASTGWETMPSVQSPSPLGGLAPRGRSVGGAPRGQDNQQGRQQP